ncbi:MAG: ABC transporter permease subunit [Thermoanaerobaculia bacterium]
MQRTNDRGRLNRLWDRTARWVISAGGLLMIGSLLLIFVLIVSQSLPLWARARTRLASMLHLKSPASALVAGQDEQRRVLDVVSRDGTIRAVDLLTGLSATPVRMAPEGVAVSAAARTLRQRYVLGLADGRIQFGEGRFGTGAAVAPAVLELTRGPLLTLDPALKRPPLHVAGAQKDSGAVVAASSPAPGVLLYGFHSEDDGDGALDLSAELNGERISTLTISEAGDALAVGTESGRLIWFSLDDMKAPARTDRITAEPAGPAPITALSFMLGGQTLLVGDARGRVLGFSRLRLRSDGEERGLALVHRYESHPAPVTAIAPSPRGKTFVSVNARGGILVHFGTNERTIARVETGGDVFAIAIAPKADGILALGPKGASSFSLDAPHPEVSLRSLFGKTQYEGYDQPEYIWQSSGSTDDFESKLSLVPLIYGTLKGTFYAMLFAIPVGLSAALYTALFAHRAIKAVVKPVVEIMAALPSVVIGFLAGLWLAPLIERTTLGTLLLLPVVPGALLVGALLYQALPLGWRQRRRAGSELIVLVAIVIGAGWLAVSLAPGLERFFFGGDFKAWLLSSAGVRYDARNCIVIAFGMGLAVVPIIFTISEDALSSVPEHLKAASLALGATPWQTATRVVVPTASAGIFSAVMLGFGRAVGETMIVLMATGNTPVMDGSIFNGMRTLSANIAVEISEAPQGGTLYRILFLAALLLFLLTFVVNTLAEILRQRLRGKYSAI